ncbi:MAG TPA: helix-turn-helix transcriptional regulator [Trebonia sp.]|nr:helix-turn-helix transcriptional regulator [Trebonia sp.]
MTVSASAAKELTVPARHGHSDVRGRSGALAGSYPFDTGDEVITGWHHHDLHQLEYAFEGVAQVETADAHYLLPPRQAAWIPAGVEHRTTLTRVRTVSVFFDPAFGLRAHNRVRIVAVPPVIREMILHARRWPIGRPSSDMIADKFFAALGALLEESLDDELPLHLPVSRNPLVAAAMRYTNAHLADATLAGACAAAATSERSLRRAFHAEAAMPWRQYLLESRLLRAMALLAEPAHSVLEVAVAVGFDSPGGFARAFRGYTGETPLAYRRRLTSPC